MEKQNIEFRLNSINEVKFMLNTDTELLQSNKELKVGLAQGVKVNFDQSTIAVEFGVQYTIAEQQVLECRYNFVFEVKNIKTFVDTEGDQIHIKELMPHFMNVVIGTTRGILVARTAGTPLASYLLPVVNIDDVLKLIESHGK